MTRTETLVKARTWHFILSGALGGLVGFALMEVVSVSQQQGASRSDYLVDMALYFTGFGLAVGVALGMTEGVVGKNRWRLLYGLVMGLVLGTAGGFLGGLAGQTIYGFVPLRYATQSNADIVITLDSSGSMSELFFFGNDPWGKRKKAARRLVDRLSTNDRVAIIDFDDEAHVLFPLTALISDAVRSQAKQAIAQVDDFGGTNLDAGLSASIRELTAARQEGRGQHVIFLTDGQGQFTPAAFPSHVTRGITIYTVGLGDGVDADLLANIAHSTGGEYFPVTKASDLIAVFESIFEENIVMTSRSEGQAPAEAELLTPAWVLLLLRILSWGAMGLAIGVGQGVRENTREDIRACALGGLFGGLLGGALFDPVSELTGLGAGLVGRGLADLVVGAAIGGSMRFAQERLVEASGKPTTTFLAVLPEKRGMVVLEPHPQPRPVRPQAAPEPWRPAPPPHDPIPRPVAEAPGTVSPASRGSQPTPPSGPRRPLTYYQNRYPERAMAMAQAYHSGDYTLKEIGAHFGVPSTAVRRAAAEHPPA